MTRSIAYSHCIAHGIEISDGMQHQKAAVRSGYWPFYRFDPRLRAQGKNPLVLDSKDPVIPLEDYLDLEGRYKSLERSNPEAARELVEAARQDLRARLESYKRLAGLSPEPAAERSPGDLAH